MATLPVTEQELIDGATDLDTIEAIANSAELTVATRTGGTVKTMAGVRAATKYDVPVAYTSGLNVTTETYTVDEGGVIYAPKPSSLPIASTPASFNSSDWYPIQDPRGYIHKDSKAEMSAIAVAAVSAGDIVETKYRSTAGDGGGGLFRVTKSDISTEVTNDPGQGVYVPFDASPGDGTNGGFIRENVFFLDVRWFGAVPITSTGAGDQTDSTTAIQNACNYASYLADNTPLFGGGYQYKCIGVEVKTRTVFKYFYLTDDGDITTDEAVLHMGDKTGAGNYLVRQSVIDEVLIKVYSTASGATGCRCNNYVRGSSINVEVEMAGDLAGTYNHKSFECLANRIAASTAAGTYQNKFKVWSRFANTGARFATSGTDAQAVADPQANGNYIELISYSDRQFGLHLDEGSQENVFVVRADTYGTQTGLGTTVAPVKCDGRFNKGQVFEEIGARGDTQYTVWCGAYSIFNYIEYHTQNVVTAKVKDDSTDTHKNIFRQLGSGPYQGPEGGETDSISFFADAIATSTTDTVMTWVAPSKCVVTKAIAKSPTTITNGAAKVYITKNGSTTLEHLGASDVDFTSPDQIVTGGSPDLTTFLEAGDKFVISGSSSNDATYTVESVNSTTITTVETSISTEANQSANIFPNPRSLILLTNSSGTSASSLTMLSSASAQIGKIWKLDEGDSIDVIVENTSASETKTVKGSFSVMYTGV